MYVYIGLFYPLISCINALAKSGLLDYLSLDYFFDERKKGWTLLNFYLRFYLVKENFNSFI